MVVWVVMGWVVVIVMVMVMMALKPFRNRRCRRRREGWSGRWELEVSSPRGVVFGVVLAGGGWALW